MIYDIITSPFSCGGFQFTNVCWKCSRAERKQSRRFPECVEGNFLTQLVSDPAREGALLELLLVNRERTCGWRPSWP